jgi:hypothetical protein
LKWSNGVKKEIKGGREGGRKEERSFYENIM